MPMGSGKTLTCLEILRRLEVSTPILVVCKVSGLTHWKKQIVKWWGIPEDEITVARGSPQARMLIWQNPQRYSVIITTYGTLLQDKKYVAGKWWNGIIADEAHKVRNRKSQTFKLIKAMRYNVFLPATGTIFRKGPEDIWSLLHLCNKKTFSSYWKFVNAFLWVFDGFYGKELGGVRNTENFQKMLLNNCIYVDEKELEDVLPTRNRQHLEVELEGRQEKMYRELEEDLLTVLDTGKVIASPTELVQIIRLRQTLICPKLLDEDYPYGVAIETVEDHGSDDPHYVIFCPFAKALPYYEEFLRSKGYEDVYTIRGGMKPEDQHEQARKVQETRGILLCTIGVAESWELLTCNRAYFIGYGWSPDENRQAEDRIRRATSEHGFANFYYIKHENTYDDRLLEIVNDKDQNVSRALSPQEIVKLVRGSTQ